LNGEPKHNSAREVTLRALIRKLIEIGSTIWTDNRATEYEAHSRTLGWHLFKKIRERDAKCNKIICRFQKSKMKAYI